MSDRTQGSVRTEQSRPEDAAAEQTARVGGDGQPGGPVDPATGTQRVAAVGAPADPATGTQRVAVVGAPADPATGTQRVAVVGTPPPVAGPSSGAAPQVAGPVPGTATAARPPAPSGGRKAPRGPRRARLQLRHIDTWSALKISLVLSIALFFIWMVAVGILYGVLSGLGVFETLNDLFGQLGSASGAETAGELITWRIVLGGAAVIGAINIVLLTALCTVAAFIYNLCADLVGGLEVTLAERD